MQRAIFILVFSLFYSSTYADSPPCWCKFEEESANKKYVAIVDRPRKDSLIDPWNSVWTLAIYERTVKGNRLLWKIKYDYTGYPGGLLSNDGQTFAYVEFWYYAKSPLVDIYRQGKRVNTLALKGSNFRIPKDKLIQTVSHQLWLRDDGIAYSYHRDRNNRLFLELHTIDGRTHYLDILKGQLIVMRPSAASISFKK